MRRVACCSLLVVLCACSAFAQKTKPWTELSEKEAAKILNDSPWGQTQVEGRSEAAPSADSAITAAGVQRRDSQRIMSDSDANRVESGQAKTDKSIRYRARFLSAKPVRGAFARLLILKRTEPDENLSNQLQGFVDRDFADYVVITVTAEAADDKLVSTTLQLLTTATVDAFKDKVYLERKDGKRLALADYRPPGPDGMGAKFVFMRKLEGQPFLTEESDTVRFFAQLDEKTKLNVKYKVSEMMYEGKLEY